MRFVWRVERPDGQGPYHGKGDDALYEMRHAHNDVDHPTPYEDGKEIPC